MYADIFWAEIILLEPVNPPADFRTEQKMLPEQFSQYIIRAYPVEFRKWPLKVLPQQVHLFFIVCPHDYDVLVIIQSLQINREYLPRSGVVDLPFPPSHIPG